MARSFAEQVDQWTRQTERRLERVFQVAVGDLGTELVRTKSNGGALPHLTGNLMRSLVMSVAAPPQVGDPDQRFNGIDVGAASAGLRLGQTAYLGYQAVYARRLNYGFVGQDSLGRTYNQEGHHFVERARLMWPVIVTKAVMKVRGV